MRLAVGIGSSALRGDVSPGARCLTAIATLPWWALAKGASSDSKEEFSPQRHRGHRETHRQIATRHFDFMIPLPVFSVFSVPLWLILFIPAVGVANGRHGREDAVPRFRLHHHRVGEHAPVPAD